MGRNTDKANIYSTTNANTKEILKTTTFKATDYTAGQMDKNLLENLKWVKEREKVNTFGPMVIAIKGIIRMTSNMVMDFLPGLMEQCTKVTGKMVCNMEKENLQLLGNRKREHGKMANW